VLASPETFTKPDGICFAPLSLLFLQGRRAGFSSLAVESAVSPIAPLDDLIDLQSAIERLPPDCRAVVELYWHGWHIEQIAEKLTLSQTSVHRALHRGLSLLERRDES
jgi:DNA-directed RNA polymerase specialized sigma24 family protein